MFFKLTHYLVFFHVFYILPLFYFSVANIVINI